MLRPGHLVALFALALLMLGVVMVNSASMSVHSHQAVTLETILLSKPTLYMALACFAMLLCAYIPIRRLVPRSIRAEELPLPEGGGRGVRSFDSRVSPTVAANPPSLHPLLLAPTYTPLSPRWFAQLFTEALHLWRLWLGVAVFLLIAATVYIRGIGRAVNGSHRWVNLHLPGLESVQPSELVKWGMVVLIAWYASRYIRRMRSFWLGLLPGLAAAGLVAGFIILEDLGTGALIGLVACILLIAAGARLWQLLILLPAPLAGITLAIITSPYRMARIQSFMDPFLDPKGKGYHMIQSMVSVANGAGPGRGLGHGLQKFGYLPENTTDFLFAAVCEELGIAGAALVIALFAGLIWSLWTIIKRERSPFLQLIALGVMSTVGIQAMINLAVVTGLGPTKGIALPLMSSGGTGWILTAAALGLVIAIDRTQGRVPGGAGLRPAAQVVPMNADIDIKPITAAVPTTLFDRTEQSEEDAAEEITEELPQVTVTDVGRSWVRLLNPFRLTPRPNAEKPE